MLFYFDPYGGDNYQTLHTFKLEPSEDISTDEYFDSPKIRLIRNIHSKRLILFSEKNGGGHMENATVELTTTLAKQMFPHLADKL